MESFVENLEIFLDEFKFLFGFSDQLVLGNIENDEFSVKMEIDLINFDEIELFLNFMVNVEDFYIFMEQRELEYVQFFELFDNKGMV